MDTIRESRHERGVLNSGFLNACLVSIICKVSILQLRDVLLRGCITSQVYICINIRFCHIPSHNMPFLIDMFLYYILNLGHRLIYIDSINVRAIRSNSVYVCINLVM